MPEVRNLIQTERKKQKLSLKRLGKKSGVHFNTIAAFERGERDMNLPNIAAVAGALKIPLSSVGIMEGGLGALDVERERLPMDPTAAAVASLMRLAHDPMEVRRRILSHLSLRQASAILEAIAWRVAVAEGEG